MRYKVIKSFINDIDSFIRLKKGERVYPKSIYEDNEKWPNWIYCKKLGSEEAGWVPLQILEKEGATAVVKEDYSAIEMNVVEGEVVNGLKRLNGWIWCIKDDGKEGWIPEENLSIIDCDFEKLYNEGLSATFKGWNFSYLDKRMITVDKMPWNYRHAVEKHLVKATCLLDMGTVEVNFLLRYLTFPKIPMQQNRIDQIFPLPKEGSNRWALRLKSLKMTEIYPLKTMFSILLLTGTIPIIHKNL